MKHYEPEFRDLHPQVRHTAQWIFEKEMKQREGQVVDRAALLKDVIFSAKKHCEKKFGIVKGERQRPMPPQEPEALPWD